MSPRFILLFALLVLWALPSLAEERALSYGALHAVAWTPDQSLSAPAPVILFSHGFHGCATQSRFLMTALAQDGFFVFAPNHQDAICDGGQESWWDKSDKPFRNPDTWNAQTYRDRADDIRTLIADLKADPAFAQKIDWSRLGLVGHSLGGYTVLGLGGAWPLWRMDGIKAILALSPYALPFTLHKTLGGLSAPVMYQGGTRDSFITPSLKGEDGCYAQSPVPKFFVEFEGAGHFAFSDRGRNKRHEAIIAYSRAFLDTYVKGDPLPPRLRARDTNSVRNYLYQIPAAQTQ